MFRSSLLLSMILAASCAVNAFDLSAVKNEPNLEKRSELALNNAASALQVAQTAYRAGDLEKTQSAAEELGESVELAYTCLMETGKDARRNPKFFKKAELATQQLLRRLENMIEAMSVNDRPAVEGVRARVADVHENLILAIMGKKK